MRASRWASEAALSLLIVVCPFAFGGVPGWTLWPLSALALVACLCAALSQGRLPLSWAAGFLVLGAAVCALQLLPLPALALKWVSPPAGELFAFALAPLGLGHPRPVSLDAAATWRELAKHLSYLGALLAAAALAQSRRTRRRLCGVVAVTGVALALTGLVHRLVGLDRLWGTLPYAHGPPPLLTPFTNANFLAGFLILSGTVCLGLALTSERQGVWLWGLGYVACGAALLLSLSRGGMACFGLAQLALVLLLWRARRAGRPKDGGPPVRMPRRRAAVWAAVGVLCACSAGLFIASDDILGELATADSLDKIQHSKIELWPMFARSAWAFGRAGMGRGAFESAFTRFQDRTVEQTFSHPENWVLQLANETGLWATLAALVLLGLAFAEGVRRVVQPDPSWTDAALLCGLVGLALHNLVDFNLEFSGCAVAFWVCFGLLGRQEASRWGFSRAAVLLGGAVALLAAARGQVGLAEDEAAFATTVQSFRAPTAIELAALPFIDRHPADYVFYDTVAGAYAPSRPKQALAFINRALFLRPIDPGAHAAAARALLALGKRSQAFLEYRLAYEGAFVSSKWQVLQAAAQAARTPEELLRAVPEDPAAIAQIAGQSTPSLAQGCVARALEELGARPDSAPLWLESARQKAASGDTSGALTQLANASRLDPANLEVAIARAELLSATDQTPVAARELEALVSSHPGNLALAMALARTYLARAPDRAVEALERVRPFLGDVESRVAVLRLEADAFERQGRRVKELDALESAARLKPDPGLYYAAAHVLEALGRPGEALDQVWAGVHAEGPGAEVAQKPWLEALKRARDAPLER